MTIFSVQRNRTVQYNSSFITLILHEHHDTSKFTGNWTPCSTFPEIILCIRPANERPSYNVTSFFIGREHIQHDLCTSFRLTTLRTDNIKALHYWPLCKGNPPVTGGFPSLNLGSNAESTSMSRHQHERTTTHIPHIACYNRYFPSQSLWCLSPPISPPLRH